MDTFRSYPSSKSEALALIWLEQQDLSGLSPEDILAKFDETEERIRKATKNQKPRNKQKVYSV
ncbi:MAG: hypothetical protein J6N70_13735 [Oribacterium sp.]|nr:hypothetical protein [Oribacterium sp.]MBP3297890.1 hypothetical protein [Lachnospiraceae bacterium]